MKRRLKQLHFDVVDSTVCPECSFKATYLKELDEHVSEQHPAFRWSWPVCNCKEKSYKTRTYLRNHFNSDDHLGKAPRYYCSLEDCEWFEKGFTRHTDLDPHMWGKHGYIRGPSVNGVVQYVPKSQCPGAAI